MLINAVAVLLGLFLIIQTILEIIVQLKDISVWPVYERQRYEKIQRWCMYNVWLAYVTLVILLATGR